MTTQPAERVPDWTLGWRLQRSLSYADVSVGRMCEVLGVSRSTLSRWMHDQGQAPKAAFLKQWALATGVSYAWLETGKDPRPDGGPNGGITDQRTRRDSNPQPSDQEWNGDLVPGPWNLEAVAA